MTLVGSILVLWGSRACAVGNAPARALFAAAPASLSVGAKGPAGLAIADVNRDGKPDFLTANVGGNSVTALLGDGRGGFRLSEGSPFPAGPKPHAIVSGDFDRDGAPDVAVTEHDGNDVRVYLGMGDGRFRPSPGSPFRALAGGPPHNHGLSAGDLNKDGAPDLVTSNHNDGSVSVLLGDGRGGFTPAPGSPFAVGRGPYPHALGDVDGDGTLDLVVPNVGGNNISVLLGDGKGGLRAAPASPHAVTKRPYHTALADLNGDGRLDAIATHDDTNLVTVLLGDGTGRFHPAPGSPLDAGRRGANTALGDVNGDRRPDLAIAAGERLVVLLGDGAGRFSPAPGSPFPAGHGCWSVALADLNGDGKPDLVAPDAEGGRLTLLLGR